jgi:hypothetical protein
MADYERFALLLDSHEAELGRLAMRLLQLGIDMMYANDLDEASLLSRQEARRLGAVLASSQGAPDRTREIIRRVCAGLDAGAGALVLVGPEVSEEAAQPLRDLGVHWRICEPYDERDLRFVLSVAMSKDHAGNRRKTLRVPCEIQTAVFMGRNRQDVTVHDLSLHGAYFASKHPFMPGSALSIEIPLPDGPFIAKGEVRNVKTADVDGRADVPDGMGVAFTQVDEEAHEVLQAYVQSWMRRFTL